MTQSAAASTTAAPAFDIHAVDCIRFLEGLPDESVDIIVTDPAYSGMNQHMRFGHGRIVGHYGSPGNARWFTEFSDDPDTYRSFLSECRRVLRDDRHIYIMFDSFSLLSLGALVREFFDVKCVIVWDKVHLGMGHYFRRRHEQIVFASKGRRKIARRDLHDVWAVPRLRKGAYPTQKPVELFERMLAASAEPGYVVCDPFTGSGSSAIAALRHGCDFVGADIDSRAVAMAQARCAEMVASGVDPLEPRRPGR
ncbi:MAG TPA: site-specific DNA-methyltransferase [Candidatus Acidoferrales bacterium]|jgi:site-specific DNA-methyltransferase (adenine-specific)|nr:site-specific DNA-methyltransferase [Candidatus Acidoferrales bacterium]